MPAKSVRDQLVRADPAAYRPDVHVVSIGDVSQIVEVLGSGRGLLTRSAHRRNPQVLVEMATGAGLGRRTAVVVSVPVVIHRWATTSRAACLASSETKRRNGCGI